MRKIPKRKIMRSLFKQYKRHDSSVFRFKASMAYLAIVRNK